MLAVLNDSYQITDLDTLYILNCPMVASKARPGQFVEVEVDSAGGFFLRRPFSIFSCDGKKTFSLLVRRVGRGTEYMMHWNKGSEINILGPLGNGFELDFEGDSCLLVAGGVGCAPLGFLADELLHRGKNIKFMFSPKRESELIDILPLAQIECIIAENRHEIPNLLDGMLKGTDNVFACGPEGMLEIVMQKCLEKNIPCQLSMERHMACGIGICLGCALAVYTENNGIVYKKVCKDGPVFKAKEVAFHEKP